MSLDSRPDDATPDESAPERVQRRLRVTAALGDAGFDDVLVLSAESAERVLTTARRELIEVVASEDVTSQAHLASLLERDPGNVARDVDVLIEAGVLAREREGGSYRPYLTHDTIVVEPLPLSDP